jgi:hypothetical protein
MVERPKSATFLADKAGTFAFYSVSPCGDGLEQRAMDGVLIVDPGG